MIIFGNWSERTGEATQITADKSAELKIKSAREIRTFELYNPTH